MRDTCAAKPNNNQGLELPPVHRLDSGRGVERPMLQEAVGYRLGDADRTCPAEGQQTGAIRVWCQ